VQAGALPDETRVPTDLLGPFWPGGPPVAWAEPEEPGDGQEVVIHIEAPEGASYREAVAKVGQLVKHAADLDRASAGGGLTLTGPPTTDGARAQVPEGGGARPRRPKKPVVVLRLAPRGPQDPVVILNAIREALKPMEAVEAVFVPPEFPPGPRPAGP